ncbi:MAG: transglutaminase family protein [Deltaproteobacteria bacterium]|nr:transglutaminase family protein [Deltaproteobacteria bacterium]
MDTAELAPYLAPTQFLDSREPSLVAFAKDAIGDAADDRTKAVRLFYAVRDAIRYDPYMTGLAVEDFRASRILAEGRGFCVPKAIALAACARSVGVPARLGFADVRNHLATEKLRERMGTDEFVFHGYVELWLGGRWVKATPTFNASLCEKFRVTPLDFDGEHDALFHPFDRDGNKHMEYLRYRGEFADFPMEEMLAAWQRSYPHLFGLGETVADVVQRVAVEQGDFEAEAEAENADAAAVARADGAR